MGETPLIPDEQISISDGETEILSRSELLRRQISTDSTGFNPNVFLPRSRAAVEKYLGENLNPEIKKQIFAVYEQIVENLKNPTDRLSDLQKKVDALLFLRGKMSAADLGENPEILTPANKINLFLMADKNPDSLSLPQKKVARAVAQKIIETFPKKKTPSIFAEKLLEMAKKVDKNFSKIEPAKISFPDNFWDDFLSRSSIFSFSVLAEKILKKIPDGDEHFSFSGDRADFFREKIDAAKKAALSNPDAISGIDENFISALWRLQNSQKLKTFSTAELRALLNVAAENPNFSSKKMRALFQKYEKKNQKMTMRDLERDHPLGAAIFYAAAFELGNDALKMAGGKAAVEKVLKNRGEKNIDGTGVFVDPAKNLYNYKNLGTTASKLFTPAGLAAYYIGVYGGAITLFLNVLASFQNGEVSPYLAVGAAMMYGGTKYLKGELFSHYSPPIRAVVKALHQRNDRWKMLEIFSDPREQKLFRAIDFSKKGKLKFEKATAKKRKNIAKEKQKWKNRQKKDDHLPDLAAGKNWHDRRGRFFSSAEIELSPELLQNNFSDIFLEKPDESFFHNLPDNPARNVARFHALEILFRAGISRAELPALANHAAKTLAARTR